MTKDASFKKVVRRHAEETGQRYTEALTDLEGLGTRMHHEPAADGLLAHLRDHYDIDAVAATKLSVHNTYVFRIDRNDGEPWIAARILPLVRGAVSRATPRSCDSWNGTTTPRSVSRSTTRSLTLTEGQSSSRGSSKASRSPPAPTSSP